jgi:hypothetical protein
VAKLCLKVSKQNIRTPDEEYEYINKQLDSLGNYFAWDVHPNVIRATAIQRKRLYKKQYELVHSEEFQLFNNWT